MVAWARPNSAGACAGCRTTRRCLPLTASPSPPNAGRARRDDEALNIWDFGGQDIYHGAHTLFMETSAVFLIVWHPDFETAGEQTVEGMVFRNYPLPYWLEYVRTLGRKDCPVVVVQARCDRPEQEVRRLPADDAFLTFPSLKPCWYSAKTNRGRGALEDAVRDAIQFLRERDGIATIGAGRMRVLRQLEAWRNEDQAPADRRAPAPDAVAGGIPKPVRAGRGRELAGQPAGVLAQSRRRLLPAHTLSRPDHPGPVMGAGGGVRVFDRRKAYPLILSQGGRFTRRC